MTNSGCIIKVPGKLMIAGEYAVLEPGFKAVVVAVDRYITADIRPSVNNKLYLPQLGLEDVTWGFRNDGVFFDSQDERLCFVKNAFDVACKYLMEKKIMFHPFRLYIKSDLNDPITGKKYGLGSSAAIVVAIISSILSYHGEFKNDLDLEKIFKLSAIAHLKTQGNGSGTDIAASVYGGWLQYSTYSSKWLIKEIRREENIINLIKMSWPNLYIGRLTPPKELRLAVGWTQESVGTAPMVEKIESFQDKNIECYQEFLKESFDSVTGLIGAFETGDVKKAIESLYKNRKALLSLGEQAGVKIETKKIKVLCTIADRFGRGKSSGAGGGDCGIAFIEGDDELHKLLRQWQEIGITPLDLEVASKGCAIL
jgi:phosphomevalonate kinase